MRALIQSLVIALAFGISSTSMASAEDAPTMESVESAAPAESTTPSEPATPAESAESAEATPPASGEDGITSRGLIPTRVRPLTAAEISLARTVFRDTINYGLVRITDALGLNNAPWTSNTPPIYMMNVGSNYSSLTSTNARRNLFIHELTHVWQGQHLVPFMLNSAAHQSLSVINNGGNVAARGDAYSYTLGRPWGQYNVEQQASIVADWFVRGRQTSDSRYRYIRDNIRANRAF